MKDSGRYFLVTLFFSFNWDFARRGRFTEISCEKCNLNMWISLSLGHAVNQKTEKTSVYIRCFSFECAFSHCQLYLKLPFRIKAFKTALQPKETRLNWKGNTTFISQLFMLMLYPSAQLNMNSSRYNTFRSINNFWARESKARRPGKKIEIQHFKQTLFVWRNNWNGLWAQSSLSVSLHQRILCRVVLVFWIIQKVINRAKPSQSSSRKRKRIFKSPKNVNMLKTRQANNGRRE